MEQAVIMGLPPPEIDRIVSWRNFGLAHSIRDIYLKVGTASLLRKLLEAAIDTVSRSFFLIGDLCRSNQSTQATITVCSIFSR